ncbi:hypothetical protein BGW38_001498 [Lunasporangiospora selenospora]|uniref:Uncharacterized protein n=1 Tax=Lunasporangiospora selenospora TaxID=979761 RepID=A0A9P6FU33_9FUNG|nr:hypothetical protein BGW38_001498 [Lunasporangiospora selenospora]
MDIVMLGKMENTGPFHADISFPDPVTVSWNGIALGTTVIPGTSSASGGSGDLNVKSTFKVTNQTAFTEFSSYMLNSESFVWHLEGKLNVKALGSTIKNLDLSKDIKVNAFHGLSGIKIEKFALPGDDPAGKGIIVEISTTLTNPSAIQMYMGTLTLAISYKDTLMGYVSANELTMVRGPQTLNMKGVLVPQTTPEGLAITSDLMSRYIANVVTDTIATGYEVKPDGVNSVEWLSNAVKNLKLTVPLQSPAPLQLIKGLNLGALGLVFTPDTAYRPLTTSTGVVANYALPDGFGFNIQFSQVANSFTIDRNGIPIASLNSSYNPSTSNMASGTLTFDLQQTPLVVPDSSQEPFQLFNRDLTVGSNLGFTVMGQASVYANTSIGTVNLVNIPFNASTELSGLQSLANPAPTITQIQVTEGTSSALTMAIGVVIINPSSISLSAGDVILDLVYKNVRLGTVTMPGLAIIPGANNIQASSSINPSASPEGLELLNLYTSGVGAEVSIVGTPTSTAVASLTQAFGALNIKSQMPGLQEKLLAGASLVVLDTTLVNGIAQTVVTVNNPFVPPMTILSIDSQITYNGILLGSVVSTFSSPPVIPGVGQGQLTAPLSMNTNPHDLVALIRAQAVKNGIDTTAFDALLALQAGGNPPSSVFEGFNVADFTIKAMAGLSVDITMTTTVKVGDYQVTMPYTQTGVATATDQTILKLIPIVGTPIAQLLVERSILAFDSIKILSPGETSFQTDIIGSITDTGPLDAQIMFPNPVTISYNGKAIGSMKMPTVNAIAGKGAALDLKAVDFTITDLAAFTDFNIYALNNPKFEWTISSEGLVLNSMGVSLPGVKMTKKVTLDGFNKLDGLTLTSYVITDVNKEGMHMNISATMNNPSTIGMTIPRSEFITGYEVIPLGPAVAEGLTLVPHGTSSFVLTATIVPNPNMDLKPILTALFQNALGGVATPLIATGTGAPGVSWLDAAIKTLVLHTSLPPLIEEPITSVTIDAMTMDFTCDGCVWAPMSISTISAQTNLPFAGTVPIVALSQNVQILDKDDRVVGTLVVPLTDATAEGSIVKSTSKSVPLTVAADAHDVYTSFIADLNMATKYDLGLRGTTSSVLDLLDLGKIEVKGIKLDVKTTLDGLQGLTNVKLVSVLDMVAFPPPIVITAVIEIINPSKLTLIVGDLKLSGSVKPGPDGFAAYNYIRKLTLYPGSNKVLASTVTVEGSPGYVELTVGMQTHDVPLYLYPGDDVSTNPALAKGLQGLRQNVTIPKGMPINLSAMPYKNLEIAATPTSRLDGVFELSADIENPFFGLPFTAVCEVVSNADVFKTDNPKLNFFKHLIGTEIPFPETGTRRATWKVAVVETPKIPVSRVPVFQKFVTDALQSGFLRLEVAWTPTIRYGSGMNQVATWHSGFLSPNNTFLPVKVNSNLPAVMEYITGRVNGSIPLPGPKYVSDLGRNVAPSPPPTLPTNTTTISPVVTSTSTTTTTISVPVVTPSPVTTTSVSPTPTTTTTESPQPTVTSPSSVPVPSPENPLPTPPSEPAPLP